MLITFDAFAEEACQGRRPASSTTSPCSSSACPTSPFPAGARPVDELLLAEPLETAVVTSADDTAVIIYTSGTTGLPKGAELTHFGLYMNCTIAGETFEVHDDDVGMAVLPLFHVFGLSSVLNTCVRFKGTMVLMPRFEVPAVLDAIERHRVSLFAGVPTMYVALLHAASEGRDLSCLRMGSSGGSAMPNEVQVGPGGEVPRLHRPRGIRHVRDGKCSVVQPHGRSSLDVGRNADVGRRDACGRRQRVRRCQAGPRTSARYSFVATTS